MIKPNWDIFKAKFNENPQANFEWFCYLLFCKQFNKLLGVPGYKNHRYIEHDPIVKGKEIIGWQAKFYETSLAQHKPEIIKLVEGAKKDYPNITKIIFYTNKNWGQGKRQNDPKPKLDINNKAKELGIKIDWKHMRNFFKSPFVSIENEIIAKHFFTLNKSIFDLIKELQEHTEVILKSIKTSFYFGKQEFSIDRKEIIEKLKDAESFVIVLSGRAGVGKTAVIKMYYEQIKEEIPFYVFKATKFNNLRNLNDFFKDFDFSEFIRAHKDDKEKIIVIDSAEKLLDIDNTDSFKEFLQVILDNNWKIIFTTRDNYVDILNTDFSEIYGILPININIQNLSDKEIEELSKKYGFNLPNDPKLIELIKTPFYLNEYLNHYKEDEGLNYTDFKSKLWIQIISKKLPEREQCFLKIAFDRANTGFFYIDPTCESSILEDLRKDEILEYESPYGYFIAHDIYEEWTLEKIIEKEFLRKLSIDDFFAKIGNSLPIRRSFRNWLSEKLLLNDVNIERFIEEALSLGIPTYWKDEILISVLLSDYSDNFFKIFKDNLLKDNQALLKKLTFLLRLACKEVDNDFLKQLGIKHLSIFSLKYVLTKPKGKGWESFIKFIFNNIETIGIENINFILPVIYDWNTKFKTGETTRYSSLIALKYYQWIIEKDIYFSRDGTKGKILQTILYGALEIKEELKNVFEEILKNKWKYPREPYYDLVKVILVPKLENGFAGLEVAKVLPDYVLKLAALFWSYTPKRDESFWHPSKDIEQYCGLEESHFNYFPASAYQTPIYWLLQYSLKETIDFILKFTNKTVECYAKSDLDKSQVKEVEVFIEKDKTIKQYISDRLWCIYRGTQVSLYVLESIHMALEKFLLERVKNTETETLEYWLMYLLKNSKSASISAVVTSIVLAYPEKTFNIARILFKTKEFFFYDTSRWLLDQTAKSNYSIGYGFNYHNKIYQDERIKTCDDKYRKWDLEGLFRYYQFFRSEEISEEEAEKRQKALWTILDNYYSQLPNKNKETEEDKTWKLSLARMDRRKMEITAERTNKDILIKFNPELEPELKEFGEKSIARSSEFTKYSQLKLWASYKIKKDEKYKEYKKYEEDPRLAFEEMKKVINELKVKKSREFYLFNYPIPAEVSAVLIKFHLDKFSEKEKEFCKNVILEAATSSFRPNYQYQIYDGVESAISVLPILFKEFPEDKEAIKTILLLALFDPHPIGMYAEFADFPTRAIKELFSTSFEDAQSLLLGYLYLKPEYESLRKKILEENYKEGIYQISEHELVNSFTKDRKKDLEKGVNNQIAYEDLGEIENLDLHILLRAFKIIPEKTDNKLHKEIVRRIINAFVPKILSDDRKDKIGYKVEHDFLKKYAYFVLNLQTEEINDYLKPFIDNFNASETITDLFEEFIYAEDILNTYDKFWLVWESFKEKVFKICKEGNRYWDIDKIIKSYLFATVPWRKDAKEWHTLKPENRQFFREISYQIGCWPSALYALAKLLNGVGSLYIDDGIIWISDIIEKNKDLTKQKLEVDTVYYLESLIRKYIYNNRKNIKKTNELKRMVLILLNFLIEKGSVVGYMLREDIL